MGHRERDVGGRMCGVGRGTSDVVGGILGSMKFTIKMLHHYHH